MDEKIDFDAIYTGYLGSFEQIDLMKKMFADFKKDGSFTFVDPAMGDNGKLYPAFDEAFAKKMATLCAVADVTVPNITEACFMTGTPYKEDYDLDYAKELILKVAQLGAKVCIITGINFGNGKTGFLGFDKEKNEFFSFEHEKLSSSYHGTGDIFSSTCVGALMRGFSYLEAAKIAALYTAECIRLTIADGKPKWYGVHFEQAVPYLLRLIDAAEKGEDVAAVK